MKQIIRNSIQCLLCDDHIGSWHVHDFRYCKCQSVAVDGGYEYLERIGNQSDYQETSILGDLQDACEKAKGMTFKEWRAEAKTETLRLAGVLPL